MTPDIPKPQPTPTPITDTTAADEAVARERAVNKRKKGRSATILTSPTGAKLGESGGMQTTTTTGTRTATLGVR